MAKLKGAFGRTAFGGRKSPLKGFESFGKVYDTAKKKGVSMRTAAFMLAINRVGRARVLGGI